MSKLAPMIQLCCVLEATARKAGNVHPGARFEHLTYEDFLRSAAAIAPVLAECDEDTVGVSILDAVKATRDVCEHNTNLGIVLLLAPLIAVPNKQSIREGLPHVLRNMSVRDSHFIYEAIRLAAPRGIGASDQEDVSRAPSLPVLEVMRLAKHRDAIAAQYVNGYQLVQDVGLAVLRKYRDFARHWERAIVHCQLALMAHQPDTDIARKCGAATAKESSKQAKAILDAGWPETAESQSLFQDFDTWLRADGSQRNPGTTADLVTACIFIALRDRLVNEPKLEDVLQAGSR